MKNYYKSIMMMLLFSILTSCGTVETKESSDSTSSMSTIRAYARTNGNSTEPQIQDYQNIGIRGIDNNEILIKINDTLKEEAIGADEVQNPTDVQNLLYERGILEHFSSEDSEGVIDSPTPTPTSTPPPIKLDFKIKDSKENFYLTLKSDGNITIGIGESYDYENDYEVKSYGDFDYLIDGIGFNGETIDINASDFLDNKDKIGKYVIYYSLLDKDKETILKVWSLITVSNEVTEQSSKYKKWVKPSQSSCENNGGKYRDYNSTNNECIANWKNANIICSTSGYKLPTRSSLKAVMTDCDKFFQTCYKEQGFSSSRYWSSSSTLTSTNILAWIIDFHDGEEGNGYYNEMDIESVMCVNYP